MSSIDTYIFTGASAIVQDFFDWDKRKVVRNMRKLIFVLAVVGTLVSIWIQSLVIGTYIFVAAEVVLGACVIATWVRGKTKNRTIMFAMVIGLIGFFGYLIMSLSKGSIEVGIVIITLVATLIGLGVGAFVSTLKS
jgi:hypothetical protein